MTNKIYVTNKYLDDFVNFQEFKIDKKSRKIGVQRILINEKFVFIKAAICRY